MFSLLTNPTKRPKVTLNVSTTINISTRVKPPDTFNETSGRVYADKAGSLHTANLVVFVHEPNQTQTKHKIQPAT